MWAVGYTSPTYCRYLRNPSLMDYYSFNRPRRDGWLSWPCWLTDSGHFTHKVVTRPAVSLAHDRESSPASTGGLTTVLRHQHIFYATTTLTTWPQNMKCLSLTKNAPIHRFKAQIALNGTPMTELRDVTCHTGSQCYLLPDTSEWPRPNPSPQAGTRFTYTEGWVDLGYMAGSRTRDLSITSPTP